MSTFELLSAVMEEVKVLAPDEVEEMIEKGVSVESILEYDYYLGLDYDGSFEMYLIGETSETMFQ